MDQTQVLNQMRYQDTFAEQFDKEGWISEFGTNNFLVASANRDGKNDWSCDSIKVFWDIKVIILVEFEFFYCGFGAIEQVSFIDGRYPPSLVNRTDGKFVGFRVVPVAIVNVPSSYSTKQAKRHSHKRKPTSNGILHGCTRWQFCQQPTNPLPLLSELDLIQPADVYPNIRYNQLPSKYHYVIATG